MANLQTSPQHPPTSKLRDGRLLEDWGLLLTSVSAGQHTAKHQEKLISVSSAHISPRGPE